MQQILDNLINNAIKFTEQGSVTVEVKRIADSKHQMELQFSVRDTGIGIAPEDRGLLFKSFSQVDGSQTRKYGGTGLGLVITKQLVEIMGGKIWVESTKGVGSTFTFTIPFETGRRIEKKKSIGTVFSNAVVDHKTVLIVEDDRVNQLVLSSMLKKKGYMIDFACNGQEALEVYSQKNYDLILMDILMPIMDGIEAAKRIREMEKDRKHTLIVAITAHALTGDRERFLKLGMDEYIAKPIKMEELFYKLDKLMFRTNNQGNSGVEVKITDHGILMTESRKEKEPNQHILDIEKLKDELKKMDSLLMCRDFEEVEKHANVIKKLLNSIDATELKGTAFRMELSARRGNFEELVRYFGQLKRECDIYRKTFI